MAVYAESILNGLHFLLMLLHLLSSRYPNGYGIIGDIVHSHVFQTIALLAMEPPVTLDGEDVRNEKVYELSIRV